jgi:hypothetical protein
MQNRVVLAALSATMVLGGCGQLPPPTPYNGGESCEGVGGIYAADGRCLAGNA